jgi:hypothetical protein
LVTFVPASIYWILREGKHRSDGTRRGLTLHYYFSGGRFAGGSASALYTQWEYLALLLNSSLLILSIMGGPERRRSNATLPTTHAHATEDDDLRNAHLNGDGDDTDEPYDEDDSPLSAAPWGSPTIRGRSRNIVHRQDSHERSTSSGGLHHRHVARTGSGDQVDEYERGYAGQSNSNTYFHKYQASQALSLWTMDSNLLTRGNTRLPRAHISLFETNESSTRAPTTTARFCIWQTRLRQQ